VFLAQRQLGEMPRQQALRSLELFGRELIPALNAVVVTP